MPKQAWLAETSLAVFTLPWCEGGLSYTSSLGPSQPYVCHSVGSLLGLSEIGPPAQLPKQRVSRCLFLNALVY